MEDKGYANQYRGNGRQDIVNGELVSQSPCHLSPVHAQLLQELKLSLVPLCFAELLDGENRSGGHGQGKSQIEEGKDEQDRLGRLFRVFRGFGVNLIIAWLQKILFSQSVIDVTQDVKLGLRHWLSSLGRIGVVKHRKALRRLVWHHEDIPRPVARVVILQQVFRMNPAGNQAGTSQGDGLGVAGQVLFQVGPTVDEILPRLQFHWRVSGNGAERGIVAAAQHRVLVEVAIIGLAPAFHIVHNLAVPRLVNTV